MASVFLSALFALIAPEGLVPATESAALDRSCYRLMAELAADEDPSITGAQYFLGRLDASAPGFDPEAEPAPALDEGERERLVGRCGALMGAGGRDFRRLGQRLTRPRDTI